MQLSNPFKTLLSALVALAAMCVAQFIGAASKPIPSSCRSQEPSMPER